MKTLIQIALILILFKSKTFGIEFPEIPGFNISVYETTYKPDNLWEAIDGAAETFLQYNFLEMQIAEYISDKNKITVEIYKFESLNDAFGIYAAERMPDYNFINIETEGYITENGLNFFKGKYYVKIYSDNKNITNQILIDFAKQISKNFKCENKFPDILSCFPEKYSIKKHENFFTSNFMGYPYFKNVFTTDASFNNEIFKIFISCFSTKDEACNNLTNYFNYLKNNLKCENNSIYYIVDPINKDLTLYCYDKYVIGINRPKDKISETIIEEIKTKLKNM